MSDKGKDEKDEREWEPEVKQGEWNVKKQAKPKEVRAREKEKEKVKHK